MVKNRVMTITESEFIRMKGAVMDEDGPEALELLKELVKRLEQQENLGLKSHFGQEIFRIFAVASPLVFPIRVNKV